ncbi:MAG: ADP-ribosylglycohydrolase family protein [Verrucomicrobiota bacterium]
MSVWEKAWVGSLVADALAMPGHWYYDRVALRRDYGEFEGYQAPRNPHPDSIFWRSRYEPLNERGDILREQAEFWGPAGRGVHYHQFLQAGENTLNHRLGAELVRWVRERGGYEPDAWLERYVEVMLEPGWHRDTYLEECHRGFFEKYAQGKPLRKCSIRDEHIGGLAQVPALCFALEGLEREELRMAVKEHVGLTHAHANVIRAADTWVRVVWGICEGLELREAVTREAGDWISGTKASKWMAQPDEVVVGQRFSPACYIAEAMPAALYLSWKYAEGFDAGIRANAQVGGDSCHRGAVVGGFLGAANGVGAQWWEGLLEWDNLERATQSE